MKPAHLVLVSAVLAHACRTTPHAAPSAPCPAGSGRTAAGIFYECTGNGGDPVILIHGFSLDRRMWEPQLPVLSREWRVISYDLRGHGNSPLPDTPYMAHQDLLGVMDELQIGKAQLVGLSNGARIALDFALFHPERVRSVVLASGGASGFVGRDQMRWMGPVMTAIRAGDLAAAAAAWAETPLMKIQDTAAARRAREITHENRAIWGVRTNPEKSAEPTAISRLAEVKVPVLLISGDADVPDMLRLADTTARAIPGAKHHVVRGAGHMVNMAAPAEFNRVMVDFLRATRR